jgi:hypothetical protein
MDKLISDKAQSETSKKVDDILRMYCTENWTSEPHHQNQNPFERMFGRMKAFTNNIMNRTGCPAYCWLLCLTYVCYLFNHLSSDSLNGMTPSQALTGQQPDISALIQFHFYDISNPYQRHAQSHSTLYGPVCCRSKERQP